MRAWLGVIAVLAAGCGDAPSCLDGDCPAPCAKLAYPCDPAAQKPLYAGPVAGAPAEYLLAHGQGAADDTLISNGVVTAVISAPGHPNDLAPSGGNLIDFGPAGGADDLTLVYQLAGILPEDAFAYRTLELERAGDRIAVTLRGTLDGRPEVGVATRYELGACDPGVRVRSELFNGSPDTHAWFVADALHTGNRRVLPFSPVPDQGYLAPELDLLALADLWEAHDYYAGAAPSADGPSYAAIACSADTLIGVNDPEVSALGTDMLRVAPGDTVVLERMLITAGAGQGPAPAVDAALAARAQLFARPTIRVTGRVVADGLAFGGDVRRASVVVASDGRPVTAVVPGPDGRFAVTAPDGAITVEVWSFGRPLVRAEAPGGDAGDLAVPLPATLAVAVTADGAPAHALIALHPVDAETRAAVEGSFHGRQGTCAPWLGPPQGASPACNRALVEPRGTELEVPAGRYEVFATAGPEHTLARAEVTLVAGEHAELAFALARLPLVPPGWLSADLHVHGRASFDSGFPDEDRVRSFAAAGVQVIAATDHDTIGDYAETVRALGLDDRIAVMGGLEATQLIPWLDVPGEDLPRVIGHFNFWPLDRDLAAANGGAPSDELIDAGTLFDRMAPLVGDGGMMMLNHPWDEPQFGRDLGYLRAIDFDPRRPIAPTDHLLVAPSGGHRNIDWNVIEVINGADNAEIQKARVLWHSLLAQGYVSAGTGDSDSHGLTDAQLGWARNWVDAGIPDVARFDAATFDAAVRDGRLIAGNGVLVFVEIVGADGARRGLSLAPHALRAGDKLAIRVVAAPWIPVDEVRVVTSRGERVVASGLPRPADPFGAAGFVRFERELALDELVDRDDFVIVEAGLPYPLAADLDDDGVPDTTDNDGDGDVDRDDVEDGEDAGPIQPPPDPVDASDPRFLVTRVVPGAWPRGFANPLLIDVDGGGWTPPGLAR